MDVLIESMAGQLQRFRKGTTVLYIQSFASMQRITPKQMHLTHCVSNNMCDGNSFLAQRSICFLPVLLSMVFFPTLMVIKTDSLTSTKTNDAARFISIWDMP